MVGTLLWILLCQKKSFAFPTFFWVGQVTVIWFVFSPFLQSHLSFSILSFRKEVMEDKNYFTREIFPTFSRIWRTLFEICQKNRGSIFSLPRYVWLDMQNASPLFLPCACEEFKQTSKGKHYIQSWAMNVFLYWIFSK